MNGSAQCQAAGSGGAACSASMPCVSTQRCVSSICQERALAGGACVTNDDCPAVDPYCDAYAGNICTAGLTFATRAADCSALQGGAPAVQSISDAGTATD